MAIPLRWMPCWQIFNVHLVNRGSVSNPVQEDWRASYVLEADAQEPQLTHRRVAYDRNAVIAGLERVHYPARNFLIPFFQGWKKPSWFE